MKKVLLVFAALTISLSLLAQEETTPVENSDILLSKKGNVILPQAGDIALVSFFSLSTLQICMPQNSF